jgi:peptidoglycan/xylan/chitin deacetylase (PgdA/CDA1 family)
VRETLAVLAKAHAQVTVLAIGRWLAASPELARMIRDAGHELGNHTWSHRTMPRLDAPTIRQEVDRAAAELDQLTGGPGRWFRPSGTPSSTPAIRAAAVHAGYGACLGYDVDPLDYTDPGPTAIVRSLARSVRPGSIVSLHLGHPGTLEALPAVLAHLHDRGLAPVTASRLLNG